MAVDLEECPLALEERSFCSGLEHQIFDLVLSDPGFTRHVARSARTGKLGTPRSTTSCASPSTSCTDALAHPSGPPYGLEGIGAHALALLAAPTRGSWPGWARAARTADRADGSTDLQVMGGLGGNELRVWFAVDHPMQT
jgi:hypothetical protein